MRPAAFIRGAMIKNNIGNSSFVFFFYLVNQSFDTRSWIAIDTCKPK
jgi:hypothetical protein